MTRAATPLLDRVADKFEIADCWLWTGALNRGGYGVVRSDDGTAAIAHRAIWQALVGPLNDAIDLDHRCRQRACCNPDHLEPVTRQINVDRGSYAAGRPRLTACRRGHEFTPQNTKHNNGKRTCRACSIDSNRRYRARQKEAA